MPLDSPSSILRSTRRGSTRSTDPTRRQAATDGHRASTSQARQARRIGSAPVFSRPQTPPRADQQWEIPGSISQGLEERREDQFVQQNWGSQQTFEESWQAGRSKQEWEMRPHPPPLQHESQTWSDQEYQYASNPFHPMQIEDGASLHGRGMNIPDDQAGPSWRYREVGHPQQQSRKEQHAYNNCSPSILSHPPTPRNDSLPQVWDAAGQDSGPARQYMSNPMLPTSLETTGDGEEFPVYREIGRHPPASLDRPLLQRLPPQCPDQTENRSNIRRPPPGLDQPLQSSNAAPRSNRMHPSLPYGNVEYRHARRTSSVPFGFTVPVESELPLVERRRRAEEAWNDIPDHPQEEPIQKYARGKVPARGTRRHVEQEWRRRRRNKIWTYIDLDAPRREYVVVRVHRKDFA